MSFFNEFLDDVACDIVSAVSDRWATSAATSAIDTCCQELGWSIDERLDRGDIRLHFKYPLIKVRMIVVSVDEGGAAVSFTAASAVTMPAKEIAAPVLGYLLERNCRPFVAWRVIAKGDGRAMFALGYRVPTLGLHPGVFKLLCDQMVCEAQAFDQRMHHAGLFR